MLDPTRIHMTMQARQGYSVATDPHDAIKQIAEQIGTADLDAMVFFCSPDYDLDALALEIARVFTCPVTGCTSAGHIGRDGYRSDGINALGFAGGQLEFRTYLIQPLAECAAQSILIAASEQEQCGTSCTRLGLLLLDGLSNAEERVASALYQALDNIPFIGASAGDNLKFERTHVYHQGRFLHDAAVFSVIQTQVPFALFKLQDFVPGPERLVITDSDPDRRIIREINGLPAAEAYAEIVGVAVADLDARVFARYPLALSIGDDVFLRAIQRVLPDHSFSCSCAIDTGLVVSVARSVDPIDAINRAFAEVRRKIGAPEIVIGSDCVHRRLDFENAGRLDEVGALLAQHRVFGFSTYGEQFNALHINHTFTGIAIGRSS